MGIRLRVMVRFRAIVRVSVRVNYFRDPFSIVEGSTARTALLHDLSVQYRNHSDYKLLFGLASGIPLNMNMACLFRSCKLGQTRGARASTGLCVDVTL